MHTICLKKNEASERLLNIVEKLEGVKLNDKVKKKSFITVTTNVD